MDGSRHRTLPEPARSSTRLARVRQVPCCLRTKETHRVPAAAGRPVIGPGRQLTRTLSLNSQSRSDLKLSYIGDPARSTELGRACARLFCCGRTARPGLPGTCRPEFEHHADWPSGIVVSGEDGLEDGAQLVDGVILTVV